MACGGGNNGSGSQANLAVATSHTARNRPSASSHGAHDCNPDPKRPSTADNRIAPPITNAAIATSCVRDQSPRSGHSKHESPKPIQARLANAAAQVLVTNAGNDSGPVANAAPSSADCGSAVTLDAAEYIDIDPLRKFRRVRAWLEYGYQLQVV